MPKKKQPAKRRSGNPNPARKGMLNRTIEYVCDDCGKSFPRDDLLVKRVMWLTIGKKGRVLRSRAVKWTCKECMERDPDWNREPYKSSPGLRDVYGKQQET